MIPVYASDRHRGHDPEAEIEASGLQPPFEHPGRAEMIRAALPNAYLSLSHEILREYREFERMSTTVVNAYIGPKVGGYVKGQVLVSAIMGASAGVALWLLGTIGWLPEGYETYAILFGAWVGVAELIPYLGPWLGAIPPVLYGLVVDPISAVWVVLLFLAILGRSF